MVEQFTIGFKTQKWWGSIAATDFFLGGTGAGAFLLSMYLGILPGMVVGWIAVALGAVALLIDLGRPDRFVRAGSQVTRSWISRGVFFTGLFLLFGILRIAGEWTMALPWGASSVLGLVIGIIAALGALGVMLYTGFLLAQSPSIPFWNTTQLPLLFALYALTCGIGVVFVILPVLGERALNVRSVGLTGIILLSASLVFMWIYLITMASSTLAAKESVHMLLRGRLAIPFLVGVTALGLVIPLLLAAIIYLTNAGFGAASPGLAVAGVLVLVGGYLFRYSILRVGVYPPIIDL